jgi:hypothetical protein
MLERVKRILQTRRFRLAQFWLSSFANQLINSRHVPSQLTKEGHPPVPMAFILNIYDQKLCLSIKRQELLAAAFSSERTFYHNIPKSQMAFCARL